MPNATPQPIRRYRVFLASPGDVAQHRKLVRRFCGDHNIQQAAARGIESLVADWENHATIGVGEAQKLTTRQTLAQFRGLPVVPITFRSCSVRFVMQPSLR